MYTTTLRIVQVLVEYVQYAYICSYIVYDNKFKALFFFDNGMCTNQY